MDAIRALFAEVLENYHISRREVIWECYPRSEHKARLAELTAEIEEYRRKMEQLIEDHP